MRLALLLLPCGILVCDKLLDAYVLVRVHFDQVQGVGLGCRDQVAHLHASFVVAVVTQSLLVVVVATTTSRYAIFNTTYFLPLVVILQYLLNCIHLDFKISII